MDRITREKETVGRMIDMYCRGYEGNSRLCSSCRELKEYAFARLDRCPFGSRKGTCRKCHIHCYKPPMRERMRKVMRYSGPRMLFRYPIAAVRHLLSEICG